MSDETKLILVIILAVFILIFTVIIAVTIDDNFTQKHKLEMIKYTCVLKGDKV
jgi:hypothetical protein